MIAAVLVTALLPLPGWGEALCFLPAYLAAGFEVLKEAAGKHPPGQGFRRELPHGHRLGGGFCHR